jgi:hypothetical protein
MKSQNNFKFGIEHEIPLINWTGKFLDYRNLKLEILNKIVQKFPVYQNDYPYLRIGDLGIKTKRLYIEGFEIFDENGYLISQKPKGFELRTPVSNSIDETIYHLKNDFKIVKKLTKEFKIQPTFISFNPYIDKVNIKIKLHKYERKLRKIDPGRKTALFTLLTFGPDVNISFSELSDNDIWKIVQKINYYTPFIIPFSFSSPFYKNKLWIGQSVRCFLRLPKRTAVIGFVENENILKEGKKYWLVDKRRIESERGRIEFKAIDTIQDLKIYAAILTLLKGLILDTNLKGKTIKIEPQLIKISSYEGFDNKIIYDGAFEVLTNAFQALRNDPDQSRLKILFQNLKSKINLSKIYIKEYQKTRSIEKILKKYNDFKI